MQTRNRSSRIPKPDFFSVEKIEDVDNSCYHSSVTNLYTTKYKVCYAVCVAANLLERIGYENTSINRPRCTN